jgi:hypothetical protein
MAIQKIDAGSSPNMIRQRWVADTEEELHEEFAKKRLTWPAPDYGTRRGLIAEEIQGEHKGKFVCRFSRYTSSD